MNKLDDWVANQLIMGRMDDRLDSEIVKLVRSYHNPEAEYQGKPLIGLDIDGTLTYSTSRMKLHSKDFVEPLYVTEMLDGKPLSFMTEKSRRMLSVLRNNAYVVPVTSRGKPQFERINLFKHDTTYAVLNTGGRIFVNGSEDIKWSRFVDNKIVSDMSSATELEKLFLVFSDQPWFERMSRLRPDMVQMKLDKYTSVPQQSIDTLREQVENMGWQLSMQGRKVFAIPGFLSKRLGFEEIGVRVGADYTMTAGDSTLDIPLLESGTQAFRPRHGELETHNYHAENVQVTDNVGILAGEEILARMLAVVGSANL
ncbi:MAG: hypothetical protein H9W81_04385 [Enterococcus sp.]|nr:hypothetical protein [Enterococcus sp.]